LRRITQYLGALAAAGLAVAGVSAGTASAATHQLPTKAEWQAAIAKAPEQGSGCYRASYPSLAWHTVKCAAAPRVLLAPALPRGSGKNTRPATVGDGNDYSAVVSGLISKATGTFTAVNSGITEKGQVDGSGPLTANAFSLQLNSQFITGSPACAKASNPSSCQAWQQFVYTANGGGTGSLFMQYWLINYNASCPSGWFSVSPDCYTNSASTTVNALTAKQLASVDLSGSAVSGGNDAVTLSVGSGTATKVTGKDTKIDLAKFWNTTEWGVYGDGGGSGATFGSQATLEAQTALTSTSSSAPSCVVEGFTAETNNLNLAATPALGSESSPTMASEQTDGSSSSASCAVAAG
jgi:hypothetical protein